MATRGGVLAAVDFDDGGWVESAELGGSDVRQVFVGVCAVGVVGNGMIWGWHFGSACGPRCWWRRVETFLMA